MLVDSAVFEGPSTIVAENVTAMPANPDANAMVYLTQQAGEFEPGLYIFLEGAWMILSTGQEVS